MSTKEGHISGLVPTILIAGTTIIAPPIHPNTEASQCLRPETARHSSPFIQKVWDKRRWERGSPSHVAIKAWRKRLKCAGPENRAAMKTRWRKERKSFGRYRKYRQITPYSGGGAHWAIPWPIVACESGGSWTAYNPSGAMGPYQLLGWGAPYPADTWHEKMENHRIAAEVWAGGAGAGNWVCVA